jgi:protein-S-isoprenylcysteine O-methyltransferase Ste14
MNEVSDFFMGFPIPNWFFMALGMALALLLMYKPDWVNDAHIRIPTVVLATSLMLEGGIRYIPDVGTMDNEFFSVFRSLVFGLALVWFLVAYWRHRKQRKSNHDKPN